MYSIVETNSYNKDKKRAQKQHKDLSPIETIIKSLCEGKPLDKKFRNHILSGNLAGIYDCHVQNDLVLFYRIDEEDEVIILVGLKTHSDFL